MGEATVTESSDVRFTYDWYRTFLEELQSLGYDCRRYDEEIGNRDLLLRHDVDWSPERALRMARLENALDVNSTYFFQVRSPFYNPLYEANRDRIREIDSLGHDVALHFSTHQYWSEPQPPETVERAVQRERDVLARGVVKPVEAVSFHIPPEWVFNQSYEGFISTYEERFFTDIVYRADSNQRWREEHPLADGTPEKLQVLVHPGLWGERDAGFADRLEEVKRDTFAEIESVLDHQFIEQNVTR